MTTPVIDRIGNEILKRLQPSSPDAFNELGIVRLGVKGSRFQGNESILILQSDAVPQPTLNRPGNPPGVAFMVNFAIHCRIQSPEEEFVSLCNKRTALTISQVTAHDMWWTFGNLAINSKIEPGKVFSQESIRGVIVNCSVTYRVAENDHTQSR